MTDDEMIQNLDIHVAASLDDFVRDLLVLGRRRRLSAGMIVHQDDGRRAAAHGVQNDLAAGDYALRQTAFEQFLIIDNVVPSGQEQHTEHFAGQIAHAQPQITKGVVGTLNPLRLFPFLLHQALAQFQRRLDLASLGRADAFSVFQGVGSLPVDAAEASVIAEQLAR